MINVTVWNEGLHEKSDPVVGSVYPDGIHGCIRQFLSAQADFSVRTATLSQRGCGLSDKVLDSTDVLLWWGHMAHDKVPDKLVEKIRQRVLGGMGLVVLHSGHHSKLFRSLMGTTCNLQWRDADRERVWTVEPTHPIAQGIPQSFDLPQEEMYGERFDIPAPEQLIFLGWFAGGEVFRAGCCWQRGLGRIFYFQPGHESFPTYHNAYVQRILINAVRWAAPTCPVQLPEGCPNPQVTPEERYREGLQQ